MAKDSALKDIESYVAQLRIIDAHEHIDIREERRRREDGIFDLLHYLHSDLVTAGMPRGVLDASPERSDEEQARVFAEYFARTRNTAYARSFIRAMEDLYGLTDWSEEGLLEANRKVKEASRNPAWYDTVLREKAGIDLVLTLVKRQKFDDPLFRPIMFWDDYVMIPSLETVRDAEKAAGRSISTLKQYTDALHEIMDGYVADGVVGTKLGFAYRRTLKVDRPTAHEAETVFNRLMRCRLGERLSQEEAKPLQDYLVHEVIRASIERRLPIQIHTGHHETGVTGNGNIITNSRAADLIPLFLEYPDAKFVVLHASLPYTQEYLSIAKNFPNVYADMSWVHIISPTIAAATWHKLIEMVPANKIQGFGGDYNYVEGAYAHALSARRVLGAVLRDKIRDGYFTEEEARQFARAVLRDNVLELYGLTLP